MFSMFRREPLLKNPSSKALKSCMEKMFAEQGKLQLEINHLINPQPSTRQNTVGSQASLIFWRGAVTVLFLVMFALNLQDKMNARTTRRGRFIGYDTNLNGIVNEPGEQERGELIHTIAGISILLFVGAFLIMLTRPSPAKRKEDTTHEKLHKEMTNFLDELEKNFNNLSEDSQKILVEKHLADEDRGQGVVLKFIDPISMGLIHHPVQVWVKEQNGELKETPTLFDHHSFLNHLIHERQRIIAQRRIIARQQRLIAEQQRLNEQQGINNEQQPITTPKIPTLKCPKTTLPIAKIDFSKKLNEDYQNYVINLYEAVERLRKEEEKLKTEIVQSPCKSTM